MARQAALSVGEKPRHAKGSIAPEHCRGAPLFWEGSARKDFIEFPLDVQKDMGVALFVVQLGETPPSAKPWKGLGSGVYELVEDHRRGMFRAIYTVSDPLQPLELARHHRALAGEGRTSAGFDRV